LKSLSEEERRRWNHPTTIFRKWQESLRPPRDYTDKAPAAPKQVVEETLSVQLRMEGGKRCDVDLLHSPVGDVAAWLRRRVLSPHDLRVLRDVLLELEPLPLPKVPVTHPDASMEDDIGLH
jgi:hypothetical protein